MKIQWDFITRPNACGSNCLSTVYHTNPIPPSESRTSPSKFQIRLTFPFELKLISTNLTIYGCMEWKKMQLTHLSLFMSWSTIDHTTTTMHNIIHPYGLSQSQVNKQFKWFIMSQQFTNTNFVMIHSNTHKYYNTSWSTIDNSIHLSNI